MLNSKYSSNPYDTTRPKAFFGDRRRMYVEEVTRGSGGRSYNSSWNAHRKGAPNRLSEKAESDTPLFMITPWSFYAGVLMISLMWAA